MLAAVLYAVSATMILLVWPGGVATRYAMPANLALAVLGGILFDRWWADRPWLIAVSNTIVTGISTALIVLGWIVMPMAPDTFRQSRISAQSIAAVRAMVPGTLYFSTDAVNYNVLAHVPAPVRDVSLVDLENLKVPALAVLTESETASLSGRAARYARHSARRPEQRLRPREFSKSGRIRSLRLRESKARIPAMGGRTCGFADQSHCCYQARRTAA